MGNENVKVGRKAKKDLYNASFAVRMRSLFEENNIKQANLAKKIGTTRQTVGNWLLGNSQPDFDTLIKIADYFETTTDYLLGRTENRTTDIEIQAISEYTGLNENSVNCLHSLKQCLDETQAEYKKLCSEKDMDQFEEYLMVSDIDIDDNTLELINSLLTVEGSMLIEGIGEYIHELKVTVGQYKEAIQDIDSMDMIDDIIDVEYRLGVSFKYCDVTRYELQKTFEQFIKTYAKDLINELDNAQAEFFNKSQNIENVYPRLVRWRRGKLYKAVFHDNNNSLAGEDNGDN